MPHVEASLIIHAPPERVAALYRDHQRWPQLFPATIRAVRVLESKPPRTTLEIHHREGRVLNVMTEHSPERIELWEGKRLFDGSFMNVFEPVPEGTRYALAADISLKGPAKLLGPFLAGYIRRQMVRFVLEPMRRAAEAPRERPIVRSTNAETSRPPPLRT